MRFFHRLRHFMEKYLHHLIPDCPVPLLFVMITIAVSVEVVLGEDYAIQQGG